MSRQTETGPVAWPASSAGISRWPAFAVLTTAQFMIILDTSIVGVALPSIQRGLGFSQPGLAWVVNAYVIAFGGLLLLSGRMGDLIGRKRVFVAGLLVFTAASLLCGVSASRGMLVAARFVQGIGGAMAAAVVLGISMMIFTSPRDRAKALGIVGFVTAAGGTAGGVVGGMLIDAASWHWIFFVNVPVGIAAAGLAMQLIPADSGPGLRAGADAAGAALITAGLVLLVYTVVNVSGHGWSSGQTLGSGAAALALIAAFGARQATARSPLLPLRVFRSRNLSGANACQVLMVAPLFGFSFLSVLYLQRVLGYSPAATGLAGLPMAAVLAAVSLGVSARLVTHLGLRPTLLTGLALITCGLAFFGRVPVHADYVPDVLPGMLLLGSGAGLAMPALMGFAMSGATPADAGVVSGLFATGAQVAGALGLAILAALATARTHVLLASRQPAAAALTGGYHLAFSIAAAIAAAGILLAAAVLRPPAPPTSRTRNANSRPARAKEKHDQVPRGDEDLGPNCAQPLSHRAGNKCAARPTHFELGDFGCAICMRGG